MSDTAPVTLTVGGANGMVWFVDASASVGQLTVTGLPPGTYDLMVFGHGTKTQTFNLHRVVRVKVSP